MTEFTLMRHNMINCLLKPNGIKHVRILHAFQEVSRETFLPEPLKGIAYADINLDNEYGEKLLKPLTIAKMLQALNLTIHHKILVIGSTNLYMAALLSYCCYEIHVLCQNQNRFQRLNAQLSQFSCYSIKIHQGNLVNGFINSAPYDHILIEGSIKSETELIEDQLKIEGNIIYFVPLDSYSNYRVIKGTKQQDGKCFKENLFECDGFIINDRPSKFQTFKF